MLRRRLILANLVALTALGVTVFATSRPATAQAISDVRHRVEYVERVAPGEPHEYVVALAVNSYVVGHVSAPEYGYLHEIAGGPLPVGPDTGAIAEAALRAGAGICGQAAAVAMTLYAALDAEARQLYVSYTLPDGTLGSHTTTEVQYGGAWHWFDPTWGVFYEDQSVLSLVEVIAMSADERRAAYVGDDARLWNRVVTSSALDGAGLDFLDMQHLRVDYGGGVLFDRAWPQRRGTGSAGSGANRSSGGPRAPA